MIDSVFVAFCFLCLIRGVLRGTVKEAFAIAGIFAGQFFASIYYASISQVLFGWVANIRTGNLLGFLIIFVTIYLLMNISGILAIYIFRIDTRGWRSRVTGGIIGSLKGILLISVLIIPLVSFSPELADIVKSSKIFPMESHVSEQMINVLSENLRKKFNINLISYKKAWGHRQKSIS
jgi:membrane protein required for colicin V production